MKSKPILLRYSACLRLDSGEIADIRFDYTTDAIAFARRCSLPAPWREVVDNQTENVVTSSDRGKK